MARTGRKPTIRREPRVSRTFRLPLSKLATAKRALGASTTTETIERALDLAVQRALVDGTGPCSASTSCRRIRSGEAAGAAFANDVLLALSCRESGCILMTENERDFSRIRRFVPFTFVGPWPTA